MTADLWHHLAAVSSKQLAVADIMDTWTRQMGYPLLTVEKVSATRYRVTQERYLTDRTASAGADSPYGYRWEVPVTWVSSGSPEPVLQWLGRSDAMLEVNLPTGTTWVKFNVGQHGFYRVNYPPEDWAGLARLLVSAPASLPAPDRASLLNDAFSLAESGHLDYSVPLDMTR